MQINEHLSETVKKNPKKVCLNIDFKFFCLGIEWEVTRLCGFRVVTMQELPRKWWWRRNCGRRKSKRGMTSAVRRSSRKSGNGRKGQQSRYTPLIFFTGLSVLTLIIHVSQVLSDKCNIQGKKIPWCHICKMLV